jgi:flagellar biosynthesis protein FlhG
MQPYLLTICSGKGGVGKSVLASNIAYQLAKNYEKVLIIDLDLMFPNLHLMFGVEPDLRIDDWFFKRETVEKVLSKISENLYLLAGSVDNNVELQNNFSFVDLYHNILLDTDFDFIIIDTSAGMNNVLLEAASISDKIGIVITDEPTSMIDSYGMLKILQDYTDSRKMNLILNNIIDDDDATEITQKFNQITKHFLGVSIDVLGVVPYSDEIKKTIIEQKLISTVKPDSNATLSIRHIAKVLEELKIKN